MILLPTERVVFLELYNTMNFLRPYSTERRTVRYQVSEIRKRFKLTMMGWVKGRSTACNGSNPAAAIPRSADKSRCLKWRQVDEVTPERLDRMTLIVGFTDSGNPQSRQ